MCRHVSNFRAVFQISRCFRVLEVLDHLTYLLNPAFVKYPMFDDRNVINDFKDTAKLMKFDSGIALRELEHYRPNVDSEGLNLYNEVDTLQNLPNPMLYWRYYSPQSYEVLHLIARKVFSVLTSSSVCEQNFRDMEYIYCSRRLRTKPERFDKLIYIYSNAKLKR